MQANEQEEMQIDTFDTKLREEKLQPLREAAQHIAELIQFISADRELFVSDTEAPATRKVDTKMLKEFSAVIKEMSTVICELNGINPELREAPTGVKIEFDEESKRLSL